MNKLLESFKKLDYPKRGFVIGLVISFIFLIISLILSLSLYGLKGTNPSFILQSALGNIIFYSSLGLIIGYIMTIPFFKKNKIIAILVILIIIFLFILIYLILLGFKALAPLFL